MFTIHLDKLNFFAHHGLHDEETVTGTEFTVSVSVQFDPGIKITTIRQTINYVEIYDIVKRHMQLPTALLETVVQNITEDIYLLDNQIKQINVNINKIQPPIKNFTGEVGVSFTKDFNL